MPRIRQYADRDAMKDLVGEINAQCGRFGYKSQKSLSEEIEVCQTTVCNYLRNPEDIRLGTLRKMVKVLKLDPVIVLKALGYSSKQISEATKYYGGTTQ